MSRPSCDVPAMQSSHLQPLRKNIGVISSTAETGSNERRQFILPGKYCCSQTKVSLSFSGNCRWVFKRMRCCCLHLRATDTRTGGSSPDINQLLLFPPSPQSRCVSHESWLLGERLSDRISLWATLFPFHLSGLLIARPDHRVSFLAAALDVGSKPRLPSPR